MTDPIYGNANFDKLLGNLNYQTPGVSYTVPELNVININGSPAGGSVAITTSDGEVNKEGSFTFGQDVEPIPIGDSVYFSSDGAGNILGIVPYRPPIQSGQTTIAGTSGTVNLPVEFADSDYSVVANPTNPAPTFSWSVSVIDGASFSIEANTVGLTFNWIAVAFTK